MLKEAILPVSTDATKSGPSIFFEGSVLQVRYDREKNDGTCEWAEVLFSEVLAYRFHQSVGYDFILPMECNKIMHFENSAWINDILDRWDRAVGWQEYQQRLGGRSRFDHFAMMFDDVGVLEIIASDYNVRGWSPHLERPLVT